MSLLCPCSASDRDRSLLTSIVAGFTSTIELDLTVANPGEDAFQASLTFDLPSNTLELVNVFNQTVNGEVNPKYTIMPTISVMRQLRLNDIYVL